ncbi:helix-turn-helix domain-containing protein [Glutamicibacter bergerei]|uniref:Helix-turn-helix domain-containing protein n=1 Tax=Glutamicibacter bergerei TaxID=256702 RepID=A0ABV9MR02_9MICC|nr:hypothetical protein [Micrococcaceae bacterium]
MEDKQNPLEVALSKQIRVELAEREWSQDFLAEKVGITKATLSRYLKGHRSMPLPTLYEIAKAFGMSLREIMTKAEDRISLEDRWF